jgi:PhnB protein
MTRQTDTTADIAEIGRLLAAHAGALHDKDIDAALALVSKDVLSFDLAPPLLSRGAQAYRRNLEDWFPTWDGPIDFEQTDLKITVGDAVAFTTSLTRMGGIKLGEGSVYLWVRATLGLRKIGGRWRVVHEHVSTPFYMDGSLKAAVDLTPES